MADWRSRIVMNWSEINDLSNEGMATSRILKSLGVNKKMIGQLCKQLQIEYKEEETSFQRAVSILRAVHPKISLVDLIDVKSGKKIDEAIDMLCDIPKTCILFWRIEKTQNMTAMVSGYSLNTSPLGNIVIKPGIRYIACNNEIQVWEQDPVTLLRSFGRNMEV